MLRGRSLIRIAATATLALLTIASRPAAAQAVPPNGFYLPGTNTLGFTTNSTTALTITSTQSVGIGTTTPGALLEVNGNLKVDGTCIGCGPGTFNLGTSTTAASPQISGDATSGFYTAGAGKVDVTISGTKTVEWNSTGENIAAGNLTVPSGTTSIGTTSTGATLRVDNSNATPNANVRGLYISDSLSTTNTAGFLSGILINPTLSVTTTVNFVYGTQIAVQNSSSGVVTNLYGNNVSTTNSGTGTVTNMYGDYLAPANFGTGTVTNMYGAYAALQNTASGGTVTTMTALYGQCQNTNAHGNVGTCYAAYLDTPVTTGAITTKYGLYQADANSNNYFAGNVGIGTVPSYKLDVNGPGHFSYIGLGAAPTNAYEVYVQPPGSVHGIHSESNTSGYYGIISYANVAGAIAGGFFDGAGNSCTFVYSLTAWSCSSDARLKQDIKPIEGALDRLALVKGVTFRWRADPKTGEKMGVIAQDVIKAFPDAVTLDPPRRKDAKSYYSVTYDALIAPLISGVNELNVRTVGLPAKIEQLEKSNADLKANNDRLEQEISDLRAEVKALHSVSKAKAPARMWQPAERQMPAYSTISSGGAIN